MSKRSTRGKGLLEPFLARLRFYYVSKIIPKELRASILDIGCGFPPLFLKKVNFRNKYGIDINLKKDAKEKSIHLISLDATSGLPFKENSFEVITMLAVIEHIKETEILSLLKDCRKILKKGGLLIITTPSPSSIFLLRLMCKLNLVSKEEIYEHKKHYTLREITNKLIQSGFDKNRIKKKKFEFSMNLLVYAYK